MQITVVPSLSNDYSDNYIYVLHAAGGRVLMVDPGDGTAACAAVAGKALAGVLITHNHWDHTDGVPAVRAAHPDVPIYAPAGCGIPGAQMCAGGDALELLDGEVHLRVLATPGHTLEHIVFAGDGFVFSGDTLFIGGCGRVLGGTLAQMYESLMTLAALPDETRIYCGHEYTLANLRFAAAVEPESAAIRARLQEVEKMRAAGMPTVPGTMAEERETNPFLRVGEEAVIRAAQAQSGKEVTAGAEVFAVLRRWKDGF